MTVSERGRPDYYTYIQSDQWRKKANEAKQRAGYRCQVCNKHGSQVTLDAHHRTYERLGNELPGDITVLCRDCHQLYEFNKHKPRATTLTRPAAFKHSQNGTAQVHASATALDKPDEAIKHEPVEKSYFEPSTYFLARMGTVTLGLAIAGNVLWLSTLTWSTDLDIRSLQITLDWITSALYWQFMLVIVLGGVLKFLGEFLANKVEPSMGMLRWYWQWKGTAVVKVPFFLVLSVQGLVWGGMGVILSTIRIASQQLDIFTFPVVLPVLRLLVVILPLPIVHLIWDNEYKDGWLKLILSVVAVALLAVAGVAIEMWWAGTLCGLSLMSEADCNFYWLMRGFFGSFSR